MGILEGFIGGAANSMAGDIGQQMQADRQQALAQFNAEIEDRKQRTLLILRESMADKQRTDQIGRIDQAAGGLVQPAIEQKRTQVQSGIEDQGSWTPEQQSTVDQSLALEKSRAVADPRVRTQAAIQTGDISPKEAATLTSQADIQQMRNEAAVKEMENKNQRAADKNENALAIAGLRGSIGGKAPAGYRFTGDGGLEAIPGGPADKNAKDKPLAGAVLKQLQETRDNAATISNLSQSFKDEFASKGVFGIGADASMSAKATLGSDKDAVEWWKNYKKQSELVERHAMFGASLTPGEQNSWRSADISPGMDADVIKRNLATRAELTRNMLENTRQDFIDAGHSEARVNSIAGRRAGERKDAEKASAQPMPKEKAALQTGSVYQTARGPAKWNGAAFEAQ